MFWGECHSGHLTPIRMACSSEGFFFLYITRVQISEDTQVSFLARKSPAASAIPHMTKFAILIAPLGVCVS